jgi:hypothetical protein
VHRCHQSFFDAKAFFQEDMHHGCETVRRATRVRDDVVFRRVVLLVVNAHNDRDVIVFRRRGNDHLLRSGLDMAARFSRFSE